MMRPWGWHGMWGCGESSVAVNLVGPVFAGGLIGVQSGRARVAYMMVAADGVLGGHGAWACVRWPGPLEGWVPAYKQQQA